MKQVWPTTNDGHSLRYSRKTAHGVKVESLGPANVAGEAKECTQLIGVMNLTLAGAGPPFDGVVVDLIETTGWENSLVERRVGKQVGSQGIVR